MEPTTLFVSFDHDGDAIIQVHYTDGKWQEFTVSQSQKVTEIDLIVPDIDLTVPDSNLDN